MSHASDREILAALGQGQRNFGWDEWFGDVEGADYLTASGKQAAARAITDLTKFFGDGWLHRAMEPGPSGPAIPILAHYAPLLALADRERPRRYVESIRWWASLQTIVAENIGGLSGVRREVRRNLTTHRLLHTLTQARLASIGMYLGAQVVLEPGKAGGPGDVLLRWSGHELFIEIVTFGPDEQSALEDKHHQHHFLHLLSLRPTESVYWEGDIPGFLNKTAEAAWMLATADAAAHCAHTGQAVEIPSPDGTLLTVRPGAAPPGTSTEGPYLETDDGARLARILDRKGAQTRDAGIAWVWAEDYGGIHPLTVFAGMTIEDKLGALADLAGPILADRPHLAGIAWSTAQWHSSPADGQAQTLAGTGVQRALPIERVRQTVVLNRRLILPDQTTRVIQISDAETRWQDWALARLGISGGVRALLNQPLSPPKSRLWLPRA